MSCPDSLRDPIERRPEMVGVCRGLPKIELHAHLSGSLTPAIVEELVSRRSSAPGGRDVGAAPRVECTSERDFFRLISGVHDLIDDPGLVRHAAVRVLEAFRDDGVIYVELRSTPRGCDRTGMTRRSYVLAMLAAMSDVPGIEARAVLSIDRRGGVDAAEDAVALACELREHGVVGIDLGGDPLSGDFGAFVGALEEAKRRGLKVTLHMGERDDEREARAMLALAPDRVSHVTLVSAAIRDEVMARRLPVELCLSSNVRGRSVPTYDDHHIRAYHRARHPYVVCTDDAGSLRCTLSEELARAAVLLDLAEPALRELSSAAVECAFADESVKARLRAGLKEARGAP